MSLAGAVNGTKVLVQKNGSEIIGQAEFTVTFGGQPIDVSNKSSQDWVCLMDGELSSKQWVFSGSILYNSDATYRAMRDDVESGTQDTYTLTYVSDATTDESLTGTFLPNGLSDAIPMGDKITTSITISSSGTVTRTPAS